VPVAGEQRAAEAAGEPEPESSLPSGRFARAVPWPDGTDELWRCEIEWDAGYLSSRFGAVAYPPRGKRGRTVGTSARFRWLLMAEPDPLPDATTPTPRARAQAQEVQEAVRRMVAALEAAGWERAGRGAHWYAERFCWRREGSPPARIEPAPAEVAKQP
jgi:hypothetical protein